MRRLAVAGMTVLMFALGLFVAVSVARPASSASSTSTNSTTSSSTGSFGTTTGSSFGYDPNAPETRYFVINATVNAASDHEIVGSSAFPNFSSGAVDNYYSMAHSHVDNSPFAEGTASPADTGPVGQTAAAGNFQQPQYADARWPGDPGKATYGTPGQPYAAAQANHFDATAQASEASSTLNGPPGPGASIGIALPKGFDGRLRSALAGWKAKWLDRLQPGRKPKPPTLPATIPSVTVKSPVAPLQTPTVKTPAVTSPALTTPTLPVKTPITGSGGASTPPPPAPPPAVTVPALPGPTAAPSRSLAVLSVPSSGTSGSSGASSEGDGAALLESSTHATLDGKTHALVTTGESRLGRVSIGGGQIVLEGIHVVASISNDGGGTPANQVAISVAAASIGGVPVTIDQDGVHVAGQAQGLPYQQASDALNGALKQAGVELFLVGPEITTGSGSDSGSSCSPSGTGGTGTDTTSTTTTTTMSTSTTSTDQSGSGTSPCDQSGMCGQSGADNGTGTGSTTTGATTTTSSPVTTPGGRSTTTTTSTSTDTTSSCDQFGSSTETTPTGFCTPTGTGTGTSAGTNSATTTSTDPYGSTSTDSTTTSSNGGGDPFGFGGGGASNAGEETVTATGVHLVFTQPVSQSGVPAQFVEHILGEVYLDSLAVPASASSGGFDFSSSPSFSSGSFSSGSFSSSSPSSSSSCAGGGRHSGGTGASGGASLTGGSSGGGLAGSSGSLSPSASGFGSGSQPGTSSAGTSLPAAFALALRKPLWLLLAYLLWQALVIGTGTSLWNWRRGGAS